MQEKSSLRRYCDEMNKPPVSCYKQAAYLLENAEGGTRTRTASRPTDFLTTMAFATCDEKQFVVWTISSPFITSVSNSQAEAV